MGAYCGGWYGLIDQPVMLLAAVATDVMVSPKMLYKNWLQQQHDQQQQRNAWNTCLLYDERICMFENGML